MVQLKKYIQIFALYLIAFVIVSCGDDDSVTTNSNQTEPSDKYSADDNFIWEALNSWYYFNDEVPQLVNSFNDDIDTYSAFLNYYSTPNDLFNRLTIDVVAEDKYSYMVEDYNDLGSSLKSEYSTYGHEFTLIGIRNTNQYVGFVRYVFPNSPAEQAGLKRGYFFTQINDTDITSSNYRDLLDLETYTLTLATLELNAAQENILVSKGTATLNSGSVNLSPIWVNKVINYGEKQVGYLCYSNFASNYHSELNQVFKEFKAKGVSEFVLDLRYNPGGSVLTAEYLASLLYTTDKNKVLGKLEYNNKHSQYNDNRYFTNEMEIKDEDFETIATESITTLGLSKLYVLTSGSTASASEFIINGLNPYIDVVQIGTTTRGKNLGSISLYNTPNDDYTEKPNDDNEVKLGLQPIVSKIYNSLNQSNYSDGFTPTNSELIISESLYYDDIKPLGDPEEQLFAKALELICANCRVAPKQFKNSDDFGTVVFESSQLQPNYQILDVRTN